MLDIDDEIFPLVSCVAYNNLEWREDRTMQLNGSKMDERRHALLFKTVSRVSINHGRGALSRPINNLYFNATQYHRRKMILTR